MRMLGYCLAILMLITTSYLSTQAQTTGSIAGTVIDSNGAVVPNATVTVKGTAGQQFTATTNSAGVYNIPAVGSGFYTVTIEANGFKTSIVSNVKVDVGTPSTVNAALEVGAVGETVEVTSGAEVLQTQSPVVSTTIQGRQIIDTPKASRDALDLVALMPGTASVGAPRRSSINGLPKGSLSITIDGVDVQDNLLRSSDGFFTSIRPRIDAIEEVTVSTAAGGADSSGDGAVQIKFATRRGTNDYNGSLYWQHRNTALNAAYWYNNRDLRPLPGDDKAPRNKIILNEYGGRFGGPIPFLGFGEGVPIFNSGKDKRFFFFNYEEFRLPESQTRTRTILNRDAQAGIYRYITSSGTQTVNLFDIARAAGQLDTPDPTVAALFSRIRSATGTTGSITPIPDDPNREFFNFTPSANQVRKFFAIRLDFNLTKNHGLEFVTNRQKFVPSKDFLNNQEERFPGFSSYGQGSDRISYATALRSTFGQNVVNEARFTYASSKLTFGGGISPADFSFGNGFLIGIDAAGVTNVINRNSLNIRDTPNYDFTDNVTWIKGNHSIGFGGQYKIIKGNFSDLNRVVPNVGFGLLDLDPAFSIFDTLPGATAGQIGGARALYATLIGRVSSYTSTAYLAADGTYRENDFQTKKIEQKTFGLYGQDTWRIRPNITLSYGLRWQPQTAFTVQSSNYGKLEKPEQVFGVSGAGNLFRPGTLTGEAPRAILFQPGEKAYDDDYNNFAPSVGIVWSPEMSGKGLLRSILGSSGQSVFRAGFQRAFTREGFAQQTTITDNTPGGSISLNRNQGIGNFIIGTNLRDPNNPNLVSPSFSAQPNFPLPLGPANQALAVVSNLKTPSVDSYNVSYQRELNRDTVVEIRYVGNRSRNNYRLNFVNEQNTIENGFAREFLAAQNNLYANEAAFAQGNVNRRACPGFVVAATGRCQVSSTNTTAVNRVPTYQYFGENTGTSPLPIMLAYYSGVPATLAPGALGSNGTVTGAGANVVANYTSPLFRDVGFVNALSRNAANLNGFAGSLDGTAARIANASRAGLPVNFLRANPAVPAGSFLLSDDGDSWYNSAQIEVRRRLSQGLRLQASYVFAKAIANYSSSSSTSQSNYTLREGGIDLAKNVAVFDIRHNFKLDATYDLPFGRGRTFFSNANGFVNQLVGGFTILPVIRWQSGSPIQLFNVQLVGMTVKDLQKEVKIRKNPTTVTWLPEDILVNSRRAFDINVASDTGYGTTFGGPPTGRFIAPAGYGNCQARFSGDCGFTNLIIYGPSFFKFDATIAKRFNLSERRNIEFRATILDVLNAPNFRVGGWGSDTVNGGCCGAGFGILNNGSAYQDISTTNDPGGRLIDLSLRINF